MSVLELAYADGQLAALARYKLAFPGPTHPVVKASPVLNVAANPAPSLAQPTGPTPETVAQNFNVREQEKTRVEPLRKLSAALCSSCRKDKHYGSCKRPVVIKRSDFNYGMTADDARASDRPATSGMYTSATSDTGDKPAPDAQAATNFADLYRHLDISEMADSPSRMTVAAADAGLISRMFNNIDRDSFGVTVDGGTGTPSGEPAA